MPTEGSPIAKRGYRRANLQGLAAFLDDAALRRHTESDLCWDTVGGIEEGGEQTVYRVEGAAGQALVAADVLLPGG